MSMRDSISTKKQTPKKPRVAAFFAGAGGLDLGFDAAGFDVVFASDIDEICCQTLQKNSASSLSSLPEVVCGDIRKLKTRDLPKRIDLVIGGPPCQSFSASGRRAGGAAGRLDDRGNLFQAYCKILRFLKPKAFVFENVRGILATNKGNDWKAITRAFNRIGYKLTYMVLDALDYGAPQQRERLFLVGHHLKGEFLFPRPLYGPDSSTKKPHITSGEALSGVDHGSELIEPLMLTDGKYAHLLPLVPHGQNYLFFTARRGYAAPIFAYRSRFSDFLYKADPTTPIKTLIASPGKYTGPFHWENRQFSVAEYKRLQGFPDQYEFVGDRSDIIKQIGNSVSPKVAERVARAIARQLFGIKNEVELLAHDTKLSFDSRKGIKAKNTRKRHEAIASLRDTITARPFTELTYDASVLPYDGRVGVKNVSVEAGQQRTTLVVSADGSDRPFARMLLVLGSKELSRGLGDTVELEVTAFGSAPHTVQTMWNAVDDWVIRSSNFHSLFELYGHFTEPHPMFQIRAFEPLADDPVARFAKHCSDFENCSRLFSRKHLIDLFGSTFGKSQFPELAEFLRRYRFDIRCVETNVAMPKNEYMVAYPFTLPERRQMNFAVKGKQPEIIRSSKQLATRLRVANR